MTEVVQGGPPSPNRPGPAPLSDSSFKSAYVKLLNSETDWKCLDVGGARIQRIEKDPGLLFHPDLSLAPLSIVFLVSRWLPLSVTKFCDKLAKFSKDLDTHFGSSAVKQFISLTSSESPKPSVQLAICQAALDAVNEERRQRPRPGTLDFDALFNSRFHGEDAFVQVTNLLNSDQSARQPLAHPRTLLSRPNFESELKSFLDARVKPFDVQAVRTLNVVSQGIWSGMSAAAHAISEHLKGSAERCLVLPVTWRQPVREVSPQFSKTRANPPRSLVEDAGIYSFAETVGHLQRWEQPTSEIEGFADCPTVTDPTEIRTTLEKVRQSMATQPAVLVVDGVHYPEQARSELEMHLVDTDICLREIHRLLAPPLSSGNDPIDLDWYARNRVVVFSSSPAKQLEDFWGKNSSDFMRELRLRWPRGVSISDVAEMHKLGHAESLQNHWHHDALRQYASDSLIFLLDGLSDLQKYHKAELKKLIDTAFDQDPTSAPELFEKVVGALVHHLSAENRGLLDLFKLIAFSPEGLRLDTVWRLLERAQNFPERVRPLTALSKMVGFGDENGGPSRKALQDLVGELSRFIGPLRREFIAGISEPDLPRLHDTHATDVVDRNRTYDFLIPEFRDALIKAALEPVVKQGSPELRRDAVIQEFHAVHRVIAEDAIYQQTFALRHVDGSEQPSIRPWRLMLGAFFHGLQSLPIGDDGTIDDSVNFGVRDISAAETPSRFWTFLYGFCYRRMIERPPEYNLSRYYAADLLKRDLLRNFAKPWLYWPGALENLRPASKVVSIFDLAGGENEDSLKALHELEEDHVFASVQAHLSLGDVLTASREMRSWREKEKRRRDDSADSGDAEMQMKRERARLRSLKRELDCRLLSGDSFVNSGIEDLLKALMPKELGNNILLDRQEARSAYFEAINSGNDPILPPGTEALGRELASSLSQDGWSAGEQSSLCDILLRRAQCVAVLANVLPRRSMTTTENAVTLPILVDRKVTEDDDVDYELCDALAQFRLADFFRQSIFSLQPLSNSFYASSNAVRENVRTAMKLHLAMRRRTADPADLTSYFKLEARAMADTLTRHLFRFPRERAAQFILESTLIRHLVEEEDSSLRYAELMNARRYLGLAEPIVYGLDRGVPIQHELSLERAKVNRRLASVARDLKKASWRRFRDHCEWDVRLLEESDTSGSIIWKFLAGRQRAALRQEFSCDPS